MTAEWTEGWMSPTQLIKDLRQRSLYMLLDDDVPPQSIPKTIRVNTLFKEMFAFEIGQFNGKTKQQKETICLNVLASDPIIFMDCTIIVDERLDSHPEMVLILGGGGH